MLKNFLFVALGGALGAVLRYGIVLIGNAISASGQLATAFINVIGSFALGFIVSVCPPGSLMLFASIGVCGAFTTFSTYSVQSVQLLQEGSYGTAALYILGTVIVCILFAWLGIAIGHKVTA